jgi:hypothetical protein
MKIYGYNNIERFKKSMLNKELIAILNTDFMVVSIDIPNITMPEAIVKLAQFYPALECPRKEL